MRLSKLLIAITILCLTEIHSQIVDIPDSIFLQALIKENVDTNGDGMIQVNEALAIDGLHITDYDYFKDITGIESFQNLKSFSITQYPGELDSINLSENIHLRDFSCVCYGLKELTLNDSIQHAIIRSSTQLESLDLSQYSKLDIVWCEENNNLRSLKLPKNISSLRCSDNNIEELNLSNCTILNDLDCSENNISNINLSNTALLKEIRCNNNPISNLDLSSNSVLTILEILNTNISELDLIKNTVLQFLYAESNNITKIALPVSSILEVVHLGNNPLSKIDLSHNLGIQVLALWDTNISYLTIPTLDSTTSIVLGNKLKHLKLPYFFQSLNIASSVGNPELELLCIPDSLDGTQMLLNNNIPLSQVTIIEGCTFPSSSGDLNNVLQGNIYFSSNSECDEVINSDIEISVNCLNELGDFIYGMQVSNINQLIQFPSGKFRIVPSFLNSSIFEIDPPYLDIDLRGGDTIYQDFCIYPKTNSANYIKVDIVPIDVARSGFTASYKLLYSNIGNTVTDGKVFFSFPSSKMEYLSSMPDMEEFSTSVLSLDFKNLLPFEEREISIEFELYSPMDTPPLKDGDILEFCAYAILPNAPGLSDFDFTKLRQTVVNSFDPNDKTCLQGDVVMDSTLGRYLDYIIRFENTGTAEAVNITVEDKIDTDVFDINTLSIVDASHPVQSFTEGDFVSFFFEDIYLPFDDANNDGYVVFELRTNEQLAIGDTIANNADIFFDFNFPIRTNTTESIVATDMDMDGFHNLEDCDDDNASIFPGAPEILGNSIDEDCDGSDLSGTHDLNGNEINIFPNPASDILNITTEGLRNYSVSLFDFNGKILFAGKETNQIDITNLPSGLFLIEIKDSNTGSSIIDKIVIE